MSNLEVVKQGLGASLTPSMSIHSDQLEHVAEFALFANFPIKSKDNFWLKKEFKHPKTGVMVQSIEFLMVKHGYGGLGGLFLNIFPPAKGSKVKSLTQLIKLSNRNAVFSCLDEIRVSYDYEPGIYVDPEKIDFQGKYYATYHDRTYHTLDWYRNEKKINQLVAKIRSKVAASLATKAMNKAASKGSWKSAHTPYDLANSKLANTVADTPLDTVGNTVVDTVVYLIEPKLELEPEYIETSEQLNKEPVAKLSQSNLTNSIRQNKTTPHSAAPPNDLWCYHVWRDAVMTLAEENYLDAYPKGKKLIKAVKTLDKHLKDVSVNAAEFIPVVVKNWIAASEYLRNHYNDWTSNNYKFPHLDVHFTGYLLAGLLSWYKSRNKFFTSKYQPKQTSNNPFLTSKDSTFGQVKPSVQVSQQTEQKPVPETTSLGHTYWNVNRLKYHPRDGSIFETVEELYSKENSREKPWSDVIYLLNKFGCLDIAYSLNMIYEARVKLGFTGEPPTIAK